MFSQVMHHEPEFMLYGVISAVPNSFQQQSEQLSITKHISTTTYPTQPVVIIGRVLTTP